MKPENVRLAAGFWLVSGFGLALLSSACSRTEKQNAALPSAERMASRAGPPAASAVAVPSSPESTSPRSAPASSALPALNMAVAPSQLESHRPGARRCDAERPIAYRLVVAPHPQLDAEGYAAARRRA